MQLTHKQKGAALLMGLIILVLMTILGLVAVRQTQMQEKMAFYNKDQQSAFQAAEAALREGEQLIAGTGTSVVDFKNSLTTTPADTTVCVASSGSSPTDLCHKDSDLDFSLEQTWTDHGRSVATAFTSAGAGKTDALATMPKFIIQHAYKLDDENGQAYFVTARGQGKQDETFVYLQSTYIVPNP